MYGCENLKSIYLPENNKYDERTKAMLNIIKRENYIKIEIK